MFEVLVVDVVGVTPTSISVAIRVHAGSLAIGDRITKASDGAGNNWTLNLQVQFLAMGTNIHVDRLDTNYGGLAVLSGDHSSVRPDVTIWG